MRSKHRHIPVRLTQGLQEAAAIALTIDVEDYFQVSGFEDVVSRARWESFESRVERNTDRLIGVLADAKASATFFVLGWIAERHPALIRRIHGAGHEIACHSYDHRLVYQCSPESFRQDTRKVKRILEDLIGERIIGYRAPSFSITRKSLWALDILTEEGFEYDSSIFPVFRDRYGIPGAPRFAFRAAQQVSYQVIRGQSHGLDLHRSPNADHSPTRFSSTLEESRGSDGLSILEIPPSTAQVMGLTFPVGGGGYLRLFPEGLFHWAIDRILNVEHQVAVLYIHPWELDSHQPRITNGSRLSTFRHHVHLDKTEGKLRRLLASFGCRSIRMVLPRLTANAGFWLGNSHGAETSKREAGAEGGY